MEQESLNYLSEVKQWIETLGPTGILALIVYFLYKHVQNLESSRKEDSKNRDARIHELQEKQEGFYREYRQWADRALQVTDQCKIVMERVLEKLK